MLSDGTRVEGRLLGADASSLTVRPIQEGELILERDLVRQVAIDQKQRRRWFWIPLAVMAAGAGAVVGYKIARQFKCSNQPDGERKACEQVRALTLIGSATIPAGATNALTTRGMPRKANQSDL